MAHGTILAATHTHADGSVHTHAGGLVHTHAHGEHSHLPLGADGSKVTLRSLLALGISGGLLPCPSALVVMLGAIALNRIGFGVLLVLVFSLGLACVLTGIGLTMVYARRFFDRLPVHSRFAELIPAGSALFITVLGIGITVQALAQMGWIAV
jgi:ABC-type nickel/cobalt efflux system permease component RcnA